MFQLSVMYTPFNCVTPLSLYSTHDYNKNYKNSVGLIEMLISLY